jgi:hypothetical protein
MPIRLPCASKHSVSHTRSPSWFVMIVSALHRSFARSCLASDEPQFWYQISATLVYFGEAGGAVGFSAGFQVTVYALGSREHSLTGILAVSHAAITTALDCCVKLSITSL